MTKTLMRWLALTIAIAMLLACSSNTKLVKVWADPNYTGPSFTNILVVGIADRASERQTFEDNFTEQLKTRTVNAVASYTLLPSTGEIKKSKLVEAIKGSNIDGVVATRIVRVETKTQEVQGQATVVPSVDRYDDLYGYYHSAWLVHDLPTTREYDIATLETRLFEVKEQALVWSGTTETVSPGAVDKEIGRLAKVIMKALAEQNFI